MVGKNKREKSVAGIVLFTLLRECVLGMGVLPPRGEEERGGGGGEEEGGEEEEEGGGGDEKWSQFLRDIMRSAASVSRDMRDAESRRNAVHAVGAVVEEVGVSLGGRGLRPWEARAALFVLLACTNDYATDSRGDVGSWVRCAALIAVVRVMRVMLHVQGQQPVSPHQTLANERERRHTQDDDEDDDEEEEEEKEEEDDNQSTRGRPTSHPYQLCSVAESKRRYYLVEPTSQLSGAMAKVHAQMSLSSSSLDGVHDPHHVPPTNTNSFFPFLPSYQSARSTLLIGPDVINAVLSAVSRHLGSKLDHVRRRSLALMQYLVQPGPAERFHREAKDNDDDDDDDDDDDGEREEAGRRRRWWYNVDAKDDLGGIPASFVPALPLLQSLFFPPSTITNNTLPGNESEGEEVGVEDQGERGRRADDHLSVSISRHHGNVCDATAQHVAPPLNCPSRLLTFLRHDAAADADDDHRGGGGGGGGGRRTDASGALNQREGAEENNAFHVRSWINQTDPNSVGYLMATALLSGYLVPTNNRALSTRKAKGKRERGGRGEMMRIGVGCGPPPELRRALIAGLVESVGSSAADVSEKAKRSIIE